MNPRAILHVDMDAFFVACEVRRRPELAGLPVIVGGAGQRGVVAAASYEARRYGVHSAMPSTRARRLCPHALFLAGDHAYYSEVSAEVFTVFTEFTPLVEPLSLDEAFLDVTGSLRLFGSATTIAASVRQRVHDALELSCSVGVAPNKFLAKLASEAAKPKASPEGVYPGAGIVEVSPGEELAFLQPLPVQALWGVGPATLERLKRLGVVTVRDLAQLPRQSLVAALGQASGSHLHALAHAIDDRPVVPDRELKSVGHEETFPRDKHDRSDLEVEIIRLTDAVAARLRANQLAGRTVTLKVRFGDFHTITRSSTSAEPLDTGPALAAAARSLLDAIEPTSGVRLLGVSVSGLKQAPGRQLTLEAEAAGWDRASRAVDEIRDRYGDSSIGPATLVHDGQIRTVGKRSPKWGPDDRAGS